MSANTQFNVVDSSAKGYKFLWDNWRILLPYAALPFFIKLGCFAAVIILGARDNILRQGLVMLPAYFAEGILVALTIRMALGLVGTRPNLFAADDPATKTALDRHSLLAAAIVYTLTQLFFVFIMQLVEMNAAPQSSAADAPPNASGVILGIITLAVTLWAVRLSWLYVPTALGYSMKHFLHVLKPFMTSIYMLGIMVICTVPLGVVMLLILETIKTVLDSAGPSSVLILIPSFLIEATAQLSRAIISAVAMAHAVHPFLTGKS